MAFEQVSNKADFIEQEHATLDFWRENSIFEKMRDLHRGQPKWSFIDGPITANNPMGVHHGWGRTFKDLYSRFWTMRGRELRYQNGFDCQGLWVEVEVEKELGFTSKKDIEEYGLDKFVLKCKERVLRYAAVQTRQSKRLGYSMEWNDPDRLEALADQLAESPFATITYQGPAGEVTDTVENVVGRLGLPELGGSYFTFSNENNYMIWTFLKRCWEKGWLYRGADVMPWCPRCATGISQHEIVTDGYADITHRSVTVRFPLRDRANESLLVWTTTPWTLTSNVAAAVGPELTYVKVQQGDQIYYLSKGCTHMLKNEYTVLGELKGKEMAGWRYDGPFDDLPAAQQPGGVTTLTELTAGVSGSAAAVHRVILWSEVGEAEGTGIVHIAPGCGAEDFQLGKENGLPFIAPLTDEGIFVEQFGFLTGMHVSEVSDPIFENLKEKGLLYRIQNYTHRYPTCWRCKTELVFRLVAEWFISMGELYDKPRAEVTAEEKERSLRYQIMDSVDEARWVPEFGHAREMDWLRNMHDWMISKKRYWGLALPIWVCDDCKHFHVVGDENELQALAVEGWNEFAGHTPHRPFVDKVKIACPQCGGQMTRIADVGNPWLDAGIVGFSTLRYRSDREYWEKWFPADWISESFPGQFRNWFYSLLAMSTVLAGKSPFKALFGYSTLIAEDGRAMHKSWGNSIEFNEAADKMGVDVMRWLYCAHKPENNLPFGYGRADDVRRRFLIPLWNVYSFFTTYAGLDGWTPNVAQFDPAQPEGPTPQSDNPLDTWILARLNQVLARVENALENYDAFAATMAVEPFIDDLTNWYVRRSRRRFWRSEQDGDKLNAYATLYHVLVKLTRLLAPMTPFVTEQIYQNLVRSANAGAYESIHHTSWPAVDTAAINETLIEQVDLARRVASLGLSARTSASLKVRQPLAKVLVHVSDGKAELSDDLIETVAEELNVKEFQFVNDAGALVSYKVLPNNKLLGPKFGAEFPRVRAALGALDPDAVAAQVNAGEAVTIMLDDEPVALSADEVLVQSDAAEGLVVASEKGVTVAIDSVITPELEQEGLARELVRRIQQLRKDAGLEISDRIALYVSGAEATKAVVGGFSEYLQAETLATQLESNGAVPADAAQTEFKLGDEDVTVALVKQ
ncbi:MAG: isoleucine--tRNA ligase [Caldilineaceae bacterium]|nr:isoleucine--tRNA ligase [Caldilineaceae bacterium]